MTKTGNNGAKARARARKQRYGIPYALAARSACSGSEGRAFWLGGNPDGALGPDSLVGLPATKPSVGALLWDRHGVYLRDRNLPQQVWPAAAALATDVHRRIPAVHAILARFRCADAAAVPNYSASPLISRRLDAVRGLLSSPEMLALWPDPCDLFVLGEPIPLDLPLGYPGTGGMRGVQHRRLGDLRAATCLRELTPRR